MVELATGLAKRGHSVRVAVFYRRGPLAAELERHGIEVLDLKKKGRWDVAGFFARTVRLLRRVRPDVLYSYLGGANIVAAATSRLVPGMRLVWSIRSSNVDLDRYDWTHRLAYRLECTMSRLPDAIIANSFTGRDFAVAQGFPVGRISVVPNGIDTGRFRPDTGLRDGQRRAWGLEPHDVAVGILARLDAMKDHSTFLKAAALLAKERPDLRFICVGQGPEREALVALVAKLGISSCVLFVGEADPVAALNGFDVACSSSMTEGFPNAVAEAMACGKPCAVTDAGDSGSIVGDLGAVVETGDHEALARAIIGVIEARSPQRSVAARQRIVDHFSRDAMIEGTLAVFDRTIEMNRHG